MSKNRNVRNAKRIRAGGIRIQVPLLREHLKVGEVYEYSSWLFTINGDGKLLTDCGCGLKCLQAHYSQKGPIDNEHWFMPARITTRRLDLKL